MPDFDIVPGCYMSCHHKTYCMELVCNVELDRACRDSESDLSFAIGSSYSSSENVETVFLETEKAAVAKIQGKSQ
jgi:hypothetical protein